MLTARELELRKRTIGSSDVPAIVGSSSWKTRADVLEAKLFGATDGGAMPFVVGHKLERPIAELALELGLLDAVALFPGWTVVDKEEFASATPDFYALRDGNMTARKGRPLKEEQAILLEIKVVGHASLSAWGFGKVVPQYVLDQVYWQMMVLDHSKAKVAALMAGADVRVFDVEMDEIRLMKLKKECRGFWEREIVGGIKASPRARVLLEKLRVRSEAWAA